MYPNPLYDLSAYNALRTSANINTEENSTYSQPSAYYAPPSPPSISPVYSGGWLPSQQAMAVPPFSITSAPLRFHVIGEDRTYSPPSEYHTPPPPPYPSISPVYSGGWLPSQQAMAVPQFPITSAPLLPFHAGSYYGRYSSSPSHHEEAESRTVGSRTITLKGSLGYGNGCVVSCIAMVAGISLSEAERHATNIVGFEPGGAGLTFSEAQEILEALDIESTRYSGTFDWKNGNSADLAIVSVEGPRSKHAVVCITTNNNVCIFDSSYSSSRAPSDYNFCENDEYLEIHN